MAQRQSNNSDPKFTDEEVLKTATASYVFGLIKKRKTVSEIHEYVKDHFSEWFPDLPSYQSYNRCPGPLSAVLPHSSKSPFRWSSPRKPEQKGFALPIRCRSYWRKGSGPPKRRWPPTGLLRSATVPRRILSFTARELHLVVERRSEKLPVPERAGLTPGSENDLRALRRVLPTLAGGVLCEDKAYCDGPLKKRLAKDQNLDLLTPVKKDKGQKTLSAADKLFSRAVSRVLPADRVAF